jgi:hypothetical protein
MLAPPAGKTPLRTPRSPFSRASEPMPMRPPDAAVPPVAATASSAVPPAPARAIQRSSVPSPAPAASGAIAQPPQSDRTKTAESTRESERPTTSGLPGRSALEEIERLMRYPSYSLRTGPEVPRADEAAAGTPARTNTPALEDGIESSPTPATLPPDQTPRFDSRREHFSRRTIIAPEIQSQISKPPAHLSPEASVEPSGRETQPAVEIGSIEVRLVAPAPPARRTSKPRNAGPLARPSIPFGLRQS